MNPSFIKSFSALNLSRNYAVQAFAASQHQQLAYSKHHDHPQVSTASGGNVVVSLEANSPVSHISILAKSGSRYETPENSGVSHMIRLCAGLSTQNFSSFGLTRKIQQLGGTLECENGREYIAYTMSFIRDHASEYFEMLSDICLKPAFKHWEVDSVKTRLLTELGARTPTFITLELLHEAAFRGRGLGRSLLVPDYHIGKITCQQLNDFVHSTHGSPRLTFVGVGVEHDALLEMATVLTPDEASGPSVSEPSRYEGGEIRIEDGSDIAHVAVSGPGAKVGTEEAVALGIAQYILGGCPGTKYGSHSSSKLSAFITAAGGSGHAVALNTNYSDAGLFGFYLVEHSDKVGQVLKGISKGMRNLKISDNDVQAAKARAKAAILMNAESGAHLCQEMGIQALLTGKSLSVKEATALIDAVTPAAVQSALSTAVKGKVSLAAKGGISNVPYADQLS